MTLFSYIAGLSEKIMEYFLVKFLISMVVGLMIFLFDGEHIGLYQALLALIVMDTISGVSAAYRTGVPIESSRIIRTPFKIIYYFMMVSSGFLVEKFIGISFAIDETVLVLLAITEFTSILENMGKMGYNTPKRLLNQLRKISSQK